jgi:hypothetical protein
MLTRLQEAQGQLDSVRSAMADPLGRWSVEPQRPEVVKEVVAALSELIGREAAYQRLLEQAVVELAERIASLEEAVTAASTGEPKTRG